MGRSVSRLLTPVAYLKIRRDDKLFEELFIPLSLTILTVITIYLAGEKFSVFGSPGLIVSIVSYLQLLSGFYITALAAIATFNRDGMDDPMLGDPPTLEIRNSLEPERLSRRRFLCFLFGYLAFGSLMLYIGGTIITLAAPILKSQLDAITILILRWSVATIYIFGTFNILITSLLGMYYLTDRLHQAPPAQGTTNLEIDYTSDNL